MNSKEKVQHQLKQFKLFLNMIKEPFIINGQEISLVSSPSMSIRFEENELVLCSSKYPDRTFMYGKISWDRLLFKLRNTEVANA
tara:strand:+ start:11850 stop:12101 length:252 start_codon:yes stop_codon:yes gene_type:complete